MRTYEYGEIHFTFGATTEDFPYRYDWSAGVEHDLGGMRWQEGVQSFVSTAEARAVGSTTYAVKHPAEVMNRLGKRGWQVLDVSRSSNAAHVFLTYHLTRSSDDKTFR